MSEPLVSALIVTYNHAPFIRQAIDSALMQKLDGELEIVVGDDCSSDGTREIVEAYARAHPGVVVPVLAERNMGDAGRPMFVETLEHCRGRYLTMTDGDDYWTSESKLQRQVDFLEAHPECSLCYHDAFVAYDEEPPSGVLFMPPGQPRFSTTRDVILSCCVPACSPMARREVYAELPRWFFDVPAADVGTYLIAAEQGPLGYIDEPLGVYRVHRGGTWSRQSREQQLGSALDLLAAIRGPLGNKHGATIAEAQSWHHVELAVALARNGRRGEALRQFGMAVRADPTLKRTLKLMLRRVVRGTRTSRSLAKA